MIKIFYPLLLFIYCHITCSEIALSSKGVFNKDTGTSKAREHALLISNRPAYVTILSLVRDAVARLPNGEGTRAEVCCITVLLYILIYCIVLYCIVLYCIVFNCIVLYCIVFNCIVLYCIVLYCIVLYCIALYFTLFYILCCIVSFRIVLYCIVLYSIVLYFAVAF